MSIVYVSMFNNFQEMSRQKASRSGRFIVLSDSAKSEMIMKNNFNISDFLKGFRTV